MHDVFSAPLFLSHSAVFAAISPCTSASFAALKVPMGGEDGVGDAVAEAVGAGVATALGTTVGIAVGGTVGTSVGATVGGAVGRLVGTAEGVTEAFAAASA